jgi:hypothetical protein
MGRQTENLFLYAWIGVIGGLNFLLFVGYGMNLEEWAKDTIARIINTITLFGVLFYFSATRVSKQYDPVVIGIYLLNIFVLLLLGANNKSKVAIVITIVIPIMMILRMFGIMPLRYLLWCIIDGLGGDMSLY